jgi:ribosomal protein S18 acetylase RimI-like enzyme
MEIREARLEEMDQVRALFREYQTWVADAFCFTSFEEELAGLPGPYTFADRGALLVAVEGTERAGCVGLRRIDDRAGEMKRLYLREAFQGRGVGANLISSVVEKARAFGYESLRLDTLPKMQAAQRLYESFGFVDIERYNSNMRSDARFMEKRL